VGRGLRQTQLQAGLVTLVYFDCGVQNMCVAVLCGGGVVPCRGKAAALSQKSCLWRILVAAQCCCVWDHDWQPAMMSQLVYVASASPGLQRSCQSRICRVSHCVYFPMGIEQCTAVQGVFAMSTFGCTHNSTLKTVHDRALGPCRPGKTSCVQGQSKGHLQTHNTTGIMRGTAMAGSSHLTHFNMWCT
jgi:hypothetical protein